jgi:putative ABC transport system permease protein
VGRLAFRGFAAHKLRGFSISFAVFLGVALVSGTYILTDTINKSFDDIFSESLKGTDVVVTPKEIVAQDNDAPPAFPASYLQRVRGVPGVAKAEGGISALVTLVDRKGDKLGNGFAPNFVFSTLQKPFQTVTYTDGRAPRTAKEAALDKATSDRSGLKVGDQVGVAGDTSVARYPIVGLNKLGDTSTGGAASVTLTLPEARRVTDREGKFDQISVAAAGNVPPAQLKRRLEKVLPAKTVRVETATESSDRQTKDIGDDLSFLNIALLVLSGVIVVVAAFLIFNTFSITVAQRIREFGLLRALGAKRRQVLQSVIGEALVIGVIGSGLGVLGGFGAAKGLSALLKAIGVDLPNRGNVFETRTAVVAVILGMVVPLVASLTPALRATRVTPMAALREAELPESRGRGIITAIVAALLGLGGLALLLYGLFGGIESSGSAAGMMGGGAAAILFSVSLYSPRLVKPLASVAGRPIEKLRGIPGRLARENAMRKPGRTAVTAAALMIGLALVTFVTVFAAGINASTSAAIDRNLQGDIFIQNQDGFSPIPASIAPGVRKIDGIDKVSTLRVGQAKVVGQRGNKRASGFDPRTVNDVFNLEWKKGSDATARNLADDETVIDEAYGKSNDVGVGDTITVEGQTARRARFKIVGSVKDNADLIGDFVVTQRAMSRDLAINRDTYVLATVVGGAKVKAVQKRVTALLKRSYPSAEAFDQQELKDNQKEQLQPLLGLVYGLLSLAVIVSIFGIVNTLALSIHERTREFGMLRAIGMSRRQLKRVIRYEAVITALIGAILGMILGVAFATLVSRPLADEGFSLSYPIPTLIVLLILAALAGVLAAIGPARRASKMDVLSAVAYE